MAAADTVAAWLIAVGGRRFLMSMGAGVVNTALFWAGVLSESGYITLTMATVGAFIAANTMERMKNGTSGSD